MWWAQKASVSHPNDAQSKSYLHNDEDNSESPSRLLAFLIDSIQLLAVSNVNINVGPLILFVTARLVWLGFWDSPQPVPSPRMWFSPSTRTITNTSREDSRAMQWLELTSKSLRVVSQLNVSFPPSTISQVHGSRRCSSYGQLHRRW